MFTCLASKCVVILFWFFTPAINLVDLGRVL